MRVSSSAGRSAFTTVALVLAIAGIVLLIPVVLLDAVVFLAEAGSSVLAVMIGFQVVVALIVLVVAVLAYRRAARDGTRRSRAAVVLSSIALFVNLLVGVPAIALAG